MRLWRDDKDAKNDLTPGHSKWPGVLTLKDRRSPLADVMQNWRINSHVKFRGATRRGFSLFMKNVKGSGSYQTPPPRRANIAFCQCDLLRTNFKEYKGHAKCVPSMPKLLTVLISFSTSVLASAHCCHLIHDRYDWNQFVISNSTHCSPGIVVDLSKENVLEVCSRRKFCHFAPSMQSEPHPP